MIVEPDIILTDIRATSKKQVLTEISREISRHLNRDAKCSSLLDAMLDREKIGSTGIGEGIAIPHIRLSCLDRCISAFIRLKTPVSYDSHDGEAVDLIYIFMAPENPDTKSASLMQLARISHFFRDREFCDMLRTTDDIQGLICFRNSEMTAAA